MSVSALPAHDEAEPGAARLAPRAGLGRVPEPDRLDGTRDRFRDTEVSLFRSRLAARTSTGPDRR